MGSSQVNLPVMPAAASGAVPTQEHDVPSGPMPAGRLISAYRIEQLVGMGGMGWVYQARHELTARRVALKILREDQLALDRSIDRMMREASILASVGHAGLPRFFECGLLDDGRPWIAMELVEGGSLMQRMQQGPIEPDVVIHIVMSVAEVLAAAHARGVTHRDLKPDNIVLAPDDACFPVRVIDWGISHHLAGTRFTNRNEAIGTPTYMAPEQARGGPTGGHCDVYGLGVVAYQALTGRAPFVGASSVEILVQHLNRPAPALAPRCPDAPYGLVELVERMLLKNHAERPTADEICDALGRLRAARRTSPCMRTATTFDSCAPHLIIETAVTPMTALPHATWADSED
ncbi:MAG: serine/threonine protein kinase [Myxococcales bacterium]|nr:serine/threonine protein kinase [Myxococcales bacterium]